MNKWPQGSFITIPLDQAMSGENNFIIQTSRHSTIPVRTKYYKKQKLS